MMIDKYPTNIKELQDYLKPGVILKLTKYDGSGKVNIGMPCEIVKVVRAIDDLFTTENCNKFRKTVRLTKCDFEGRFSYGAGIEFFKNGFYSISRYRLRLDNENLVKDESGKYYQILAKYEYTDLTELPKIDSVAFKQSKKKMIIELDLDRIAETYENMQIYKIKDSAEFKSFLEDQIDSALNLYLSYPHLKELDPYIKE